MAINYFSTPILLSCIEHLEPCPTFLTDRYFVTDGTSLAGVSDIVVEYKDGDKIAAPWVHPRIHGKTLARKGYIAKTIQPGTIKVARTISIEDLKKKAFGEQLFTPLAPEQRLQALITKDLTEMRQAIVRRKEAMCAQIMFSNACVMKEYIDENRYEEKEVRYYDGENPDIYTPSAYWTTTEASGKQIIKDLTAMIRKRQKMGVETTEVLCSPDVVDVLQGNEYIQKLLDLRRYEVGSVKPTELGGGTFADCFMQLNVKGRLLSFIAYDGEYVETEGGDPISFIPAGMICMTAPKQGKIIYGAITQYGEDDQPHTYSAEYVPNVFINRKAGTQEHTLESRPLGMPLCRCSFLTAQVLAPASEPEPEPDKEKEDKEDKEQGGGVQGGGIQGGE